MRIISKVPDADDGAAPNAAPAFTLSNGVTLARAPLLGFHPKLPYAAYEQDPAVRHSTLNRLHTSPLSLKTYLEHGDDDSTEKTLGRVLHLLVLEPEREKDQVVVVQASDRRTNLFKGAASEHPGKDIILQKEQEDLYRMRDRFFARADTRAELAGAFAEASLFWDDEATGLACKARPDLLADGRVTDIKTTADMGRFRWDAERYGYFRQAAWYLAGAEAVMERRFVSYRLIVSEKKAPWDCRIFEVGPKALAEARRQNAKNLATYQRCLQLGDWPGYPEVVEELVP